MKRTRHGSRVPRCLRWLFIFVARQRRGPCARAGLADRPVRIVAPFAPGGSADTLGRLVAERLVGRGSSRTSSWTTAPGAGGTVGSELVADSAPDGYTLLVSGIATHAIGPAMSKVPFDPVSELHAHRAVRRPAHHRRSASRRRSEEPRAVRGAVEIDAAGHFVRFARAGHERPSRRRAVSRAERLEPGAHTLQGRRARDDRPGRRAHPRQLQHAVHRGAARQVGARARARAFRGEAGIGVSRCADIRRERLQGSRRDDVVLAVRSGGHAARRSSSSSTRRCREALAAPELRERLAAEGIEPNDLDPAGFTRFVRAEVARWAPVARGSDR